MSKSIYEEALEELTWLVHDEFNDTPNHPEPNVSQRLDMFKKVKQALEQAQKQEKLLELYEALVSVKDDMLSYCEVVDDDYYDSKELATSFEKQIKE